MKILAIESSCDETAAAVVEDGTRILSNVVVSQIDIFAEYGGVIPEVAARSHLDVILPVIHKAMADAGVGKGEIDAIAVTHTPGLLGSLLIGTLTARMLAILWGKPLYAVHHLKSHIYANWLNNEIADDTVFVQHGCAAPHLKNRSQHSLGSQATMLHKNVSSTVSLSSDSQSNLSNDVPQFPLLALVVSGGHTQIIYMQGHNQFEIIGTTRDDAVGECFDKVAKILGLPYPGGPSIDQLAAISSLNSLARSHRTVCTASLHADATNVANRRASSRKKEQSLSSLNFYDGTNSPRTSSQFETIEEQEWYKEHPNYRLPHPKVEGLDFSFSGLKTAVLRAVQAELGVPINTPSHTLAEKLMEVQRADFAAAFQWTACEILLEKMEKALEMHPEGESIVIAGGVSASEKLREMALERFSRRVKVFFPERRFAGDNAAMVGAAAYYEIQEGVKAADPYALDIAPRSVIS